MANADQRHPLHGQPEPLPPRDAVYLSTSDKGIFKISQGGGVVKNVGPLNDQEWASLGSTCGATAETDLFYAYDPKKLGLVLFTAEQLDPDSRGTCAAGRRRSACRAAAPVAL